MPTARPALNKAPWRRARAAVKRANPRCAACGTTSGRLEADHIIPAAAGGGDARSNLQVLCTKCNKVKGGRLMSLEEIRTRRAEAERGKATTVYGRSTWVPLTGDYSRKKVRAK